MITRDTEGKKGKSMRVLVTGGNGKLGKWVARELRDHGYDVVSVDRHLPATREPGIQSRHIETSDLGQVIGAAAGCDAVIHLAAIPNPYSHPDEVVFLNNVGATYNILQAAMTLGIERAIIASSVSAYGMAWSRPTFPPLYVPIDEDHPFIAKDPYALSKETDERTAEMFVRRCGMTVLAYRIHWIAEPGEARRRVEELAPHPEQDATNIWGYVDVRDAARAFRLGLEANLSGFIPINIIAADTLRAEPTEDLVRVHLPTTEIRAPIPGIATGWSIDRARDLLGFVPEHSWRDA
jgi:nucleoside-diphosphate-sugar epimerase